MPGLLLSMPASAFVSVSDATVTEGGVLVFTLTRTGGIPSQLAGINFATSSSLEGATAKSNDDFMPMVGRWVFSQNPSETTFEVPVATVDDGYFEGDEIFHLRLSASMLEDPPFQTTPATGTIIDNDDRPVVSIRTLFDTTEGDRSAFELSISGDYESTQVVDYRTVNGTATHPEDFTGIASLTARFHPGEPKTKLIEIFHVDDNVVEPNETFFVEITRVLSAHNHITGSDSGIVLSETENRAMGTIINDDFDAPTVVLTAPENGSGFDVGQQIAITASAFEGSDGGSIRAVRFYVNGVLVDTVTSPPYDTQWTATDAAEHVITAVVTNGFNNSGESAVVTITRNEPVLQIPDVPANLISSTGTDNDTGAYTISWDTVADANSYTLQECNLSICSDTGWRTIAEGNETTVSVVGKTSGQYAYRVNACGIEGCSAFSSPLIVNVTVFVSDLGNPGEITWTVPFRANIGSSPAVSDDGTVYIASADHYLYAYNREGALEWRFKAEDHIAATPALSADGETVYFGDYAGYIYAVNAESGLQRWRYQTSSGVVFSSPAIVNVESENDFAALRINNVLYIAAGNRLYAFNADTGTVLGAVDVDSEIGASIAVHVNGDAYIGTANGTVYVLNLMPSVSGRSVDGHAVDFEFATLWQYSTGTGQGIASVAIGATGLVYAGSMDQMLYAFDVNAVDEASRLRWSTALDGRIAGSPGIAQDGTLYIGTFDNAAMHAVDGETGILIWSYPVAGDVYSSPAIGSDGRVYFGDMANTFYSLDPAGFVSGDVDDVLDWTVDLQSAVIASPVVNNGQVYIAALDSGLFSIETSSKWLARSSWPAFRRAVIRDGVQNDSDGDGLPDTFEIANNLNPNDAADALLDPDGDGLSNYDEFLNGTNIRNADTDDDGLPDGWEVLHGLNALLADADEDADGDGVSNFDEWIAGTDPNMPVNVDGQSAGDEAWVYNPDLYSERIVSTPVFAEEGTVYVITGNRLHAVNTDGSEQWTQAANDSAFSDFGHSAAIGADDTIYFPSARRLNAVTSAGVMRWSYAVTSDLGTPSVAKDGTIYFLTQAGTVYALDAEGVLQWRYELGVNDNFVADTAIAIATDGTLYVPHASGIHALDPDGNLLWTYLLDNAYVSSSQVSIDFNSALYFGDSNHRLYALDALGNELWVQDFEDTINGIAINAEGTLYANIGGQLRALSTADGQTRWSYTVPPFFSFDGVTQGTPAIAADGSIYVRCNTSDLAALDANGNLKWFRTLNSSFDGNSPKIGPDGKIYNTFNPVFFGDGSLQAIVDFVAPSETSAWASYGADQQNSSNVAVLDTDGDGMSDQYENEHGLNRLGPEDAVDDADNDGLDNLQEFLNGTNALVVDTDGDGLPDGWEVDHGLNPLLDDTAGDIDGDGLSNEGEYQLGTDPNNSDTDGNGLPDGLLSNSNANGDVWVFSISDETGRVVYTADQDRDGINELYSAPVDGQSAPVKLHNELDPLSRGVFCQLVDYGSASIGEQSGTLIERLWSGDGIGCPISADGEWVVFAIRKPSSNDSELYSAPVDGSVPAVKLSGVLDAGETVMSYKLSNDANHVVFRTEEFGSSRRTDRLYSVPVTGGTPVLLSGLEHSAGGLDIQQYEISEDSRFVVYSVFYAITQTHDLVRVSIDGSTPAMSMNSRFSGSVDSVARDIRLSADGQYVVYTQLGTTGKNLYSLLLEGSGNAVQLNGDFVSSGSVESLYLISNDSQYVVFLSDHMNPGMHELYSARIDGASGPQKLNGEILGGRDMFGGGAFQISADSRYVVYVHDQEQINLRELYSVPVDGQGSVVKLNAPIEDGRGLSNFQFEISHDGQFVFYVTNNNSQLYRVSIDGNSVPLILNEPRPSDALIGSEVIVSDDDTQLIYQAVDGLYSVPTSGGASTLLTSEFIQGGSVRQAIISNTLEHVIYRGDTQIDNVYEVFAAPLGSGAGDVAKLSRIVSSADLTNVNARPVINIVQPVSANRFFENTEISFIAVANDDEDGDLSAAVRWVSDLDGDLGIGELGTFLSVGMHNITASIADSHGSLVSTSFSITVTVIDTDNDGLPDDWELANGFDPAINNAAGDADNDGLTNIAEYQAATNPNEADSDNDGLPDGWEVANNLDPLFDDIAGDNDEDGLNNRDEYQLGTDPNNPDTNGDGLPDSLISNPNGDVHLFSVSETAGRVVYTAFQDQGGRKEIYSTAIDGLAGSLRVTDGLQGIGDYNVACELINYGKTGIDNVGEQQTRIYEYDGGLGCPITSDGRYVVFAARKPSGDYELYSAPIDGSAVATKLNGSFAERETVRSYKLSQDSQYVVYTTRKPAGNGGHVTELYSVSVAGGNPILLSDVSEVTDVQHFALSADSRFVVYSVYNSETREYDLVHTPIDGAESPVSMQSRFIGDDDYAIFDLQISLDGNYVVYRQRENLTSIKLYSLSINGSGNAVELNGVSVGSSSRVEEGYLISNDSNYVVFRSDHMNTRGIQELYSVLIDGSNVPQKLHDDITNSGGGIVNGSYQISDDSQYVVFVDDYQQEFGINEIYSVAINGQSDAVKLNHLEPGQFGIDANPFKFEISNDSRSVIYVANQARELYRVNIDGSEIPVLLNQPKPTELNYILNIAINEDDTHVVYHAGSGSVFSFTNALYSVPFAGGVSRLLSNEIIDGRSVTPVLVTGSPAYVLFRSDVEYAGVHELYSVALDGNAGAIKLSEIVRLVTIPTNADNRPVVSDIVRPADGSVHSENSELTFTAVANDNEDGDLSSTIHWSSNLDGDLGTGASISTMLSPGEHVITIQVADNDGNTSVTTFNVTVEEANTPPVVQIVNPLDQSRLNQTATVTLSATANDIEDGDLSASINWVSSLDGVLGVGSRITSSELSAGVHTITASVSDSDGETDNASITLTIISQHDNVRPEITVTSPVIDTQINIGDNMRIEWTDSDPDSDAQISFYYVPQGMNLPDGTLIVDGLSEDDENDFYDWDTSGVPPGVYNIYAVIDDEAIGRWIVPNITTSITISNPSTGPVLSVNGYDLVAQRRVSRSHYEYDYRVTINNIGDTIAENVTVNVSGTSIHFTVIDSALEVGSIDADSTKESLDTFTVRVNRGAAFDPSLLVFDILHD